MRAPDSPLARPARLSAALLAFVSLLGGSAASTPQASAQSVEPAEEGAPVGYELALHGATSSEAGTELLLSGVAYEVRGLADLQATAGLALEGRLTALVPDPANPRQSHRQAVGQAGARSQAEGRFELRVRLPREALNSPQIEIHVQRPGQPGRTFAYPVQLLAASAMDLLTDRRRYEPGEPIRLWARARRARDEVPLSDQRVHVELFDPQGRRLSEADDATRESGVVVTDVALPRSASAGWYRVRVSLPDDPYHASAEARIQVWERTVERLFAELTLRDPMLRPGDELRGHVEVRTPSGTPVQNAAVQVWVRANGEPLTVQTDAEGIARFESHAPAFLSGNVTTETVRARVQHPAHGTIQATASYLLARVDALVTATPSSGALVPEVDQEVFLHGTDPRGQPLAAGTRMVVTGLGVPGGRQEVTLDARGLASVTLSLPRRAAARADGGSCAGQVAATIEVEVMTRRPVTARLCVPVNPDAELLVRADQPLVPPGGNLRLSLRRRSSALNRPVWVEAMRAGRMVAWAVAGPRDSSVDLAIPADLRGVTTIRARPLAPEDARRPFDQPGATRVGAGAQTAVLVTPPRTFALEVQPSQPRYRVRDRAPVTLRASRDPGRAWAALLVRDQAAHGGEGPWALRWVESALEEAITAPQPEQNVLFLRASLAAGVSPDLQVPEPSPLDPPPWGYRHPTYGGAGGVLRDPIALREEMLRRGLHPYTSALEQAVSGFSGEAASWQGIAQRSGARSSFDPNAIATLIARHRLDTRYARTLGGQPLTVQMLGEADASFTFDNVARRVARGRLVHLIRALIRFSDPDDENAQRVSANEPPERWLSTLVQLGMVTAEELVDPWGHPFVFRRAAGRQPAVVISERALAYELISAGPDGRYGSGDDVRDPRARVVPRGTPYAITSGEDALMDALARVAPGAQVLAAMLNAYDRVGLAARTEMRGSVVEATGSEDAMPVEAAMPAQEAQGYGGLGLRGTGRGGGGMGEGTIGLGSLGTIGHGGGGGGGAGYARAARAPAAGTFAGAEIADDYDGADAPAEERQQSLAQSQTRGPGASASAAMGALVRERFPATLFFAGEVALDSSGQATVEVPLADALTTYRLEAIAWTAGGYTTSGEARVRVDQEAKVDAPVPPFATVGDALNLPLRVENRTEQPLSVILSVAAEGELSLAAIEDLRLTIPPRDALERRVPIRPSAVGQGSLLIAARTPDGRPLDAVRRPLQVLPDARLVRESRDLLLESGGAIEVSIPDQASDRGPGQIRIVAGENLFGDPETSISSTMWRGWALAMAQRDLPEPTAAELLPWTSYEEGQASRQAFPSALALASLWRDRRRLSDGDARRTLQAISGDNGRGDAALLLVALAPVYRDRALRPGLGRALGEVLRAIRRAASEEGAAASDAPGQWSRTAAGLALTEAPGQPRTLEMIRRAERHLIRVGDEAWVEADAEIAQGPYMGEVFFRQQAPVPGVEDHITPTTLLALAYTAEGRRADALPLLRHLARLPRLEPERFEPGRGGSDESIGIPRPSWPEVPLALASAAAVRLAGQPSGAVRVRLDGAPQEVRMSGGVALAELAQLGRPGSHRVQVEVAGGGVALAFLDFRYGLPWTVPPARALSVEAEWSGEAGVRDARAGLLLTVRNRSVRLLARPIVEIELPAGVELDEPTREALRSHLQGDAEIDGRTLRLPLRALAPAGWERIPLPLRWSTGGTLRGLGVSVFDGGDARGNEVRPAYVLPSRGVEVRDEGAPPEIPEHEASPPPRPPLLPIDILRAEG